MLLFSWYICNTWYFLFYWWYPLNSLLVNISLIRLWPCIWDCAPLITSKRVFIARQTVVIQHWNPILSLAFLVPTVTGWAIWKQILRQMFIRGQYLLKVVERSMIGKKKNWTIIQIWHNPRQPWGGGIWRTLDCPL